MLGEEGFVYFCHGNFIKYQHRYNYKGKPVQDIESDVLFERMLKSLKEYMKYTVKTKLKDGSTVYRFAPPKDAKLSGVVKSKTFQDGRAARYEIPKLIKIVEDFRKGKILAGNIDVNSNLRQVLAHYYKTGQFNSLSLHTQKTYTYGFNKICVTKMFGRELGDITLNTYPTHCTELYETWVKQVSVDNANQLSRIFSVLINFCISLGLMDKNPMSMVKKRSHEPRSVVWTQEQVELFVETAFLSLNTEILDYLPYFATNGDRDLLIFAY